MFDIDRLNLMLRAVKLPAAEDIAPAVGKRRANAISNCSGYSTMAHGLTALEKHFGMEGVRDDVKGRYHLNGKRMSVGQRLDYLTCLMKWRGTLPNELIPAPALEVQA